MAVHEVRRERIEPLWDRVDRNRVELAVLISLFFVATTVVIGLMLIAFVICAYLVVILTLGSVADEIMRSETGTTWLASIFAYIPHTFALSASGVLAYMVWALTRDEQWFARRLGAAFVPKGELLSTKYALKDMAIACGFPVAPALFVIETPNVNAFAYQRGSRRAIVGVTRGLVTRLSEDEQRAVFANLIARIKNGDMLWASAVTALMSPLWRYYDKPLGDAETIQFREYTDPESGRTVKYPVGSAAFMYSLSSAVPVFAFISFLVVVSELLAFGHRSSQLKHAEVADAEGMLLLKDPRSMLAALEKAVRFNNFVPTAGPGMTQLFYAWTGDGSTDDDEDLEMRRVVRLREVLGVEGLAPPPVVANTPELLVAPAAPRLESRAIDGGVPPVR